MEITGRPAWVITLQHRFGEPLEYMEGFLEKEGRPLKPVAFNYRGNGWFNTNLQCGWERKLKTLSEKRLRKLLYNYGLLKEEVDEAFEQVKKHSTKWI